LEKARWKVEISSYYFDESAEKPREIDIIASKEVVLISEHEGTVIGRFNIFLFVECKYFNSEIAFWKQPVNPKWIMPAIKLYGLNKEEIFKKGEHHYYIGSVGKLYEPSKDRDIFDALTQPIKSLTYFLESSPRNGLYYPIVVYDGIPGVYALDTKKELDDAELLNNLIVDMNYSYRSLVGSRNLMHERFFIDFCNKEDLGKLLDRIDREKQRICSFISTSKKVPEYILREVI